MHTGYTIWTSDTKELFFSHDNIWSKRRVSRSKYTDRLRFRKYASIFSHFFPKTENLIHHTWYILFRQYLVFYACILVLEIREITFILFFLNASKTPLFHLSSMEYSRDLLRICISIGNIRLFFYYRYIN